MDNVLITVIVAVFASQGFWAWLMSHNNKKSAKTKLIMGLGFAEICKRAEIFIERGEITTEEFKDFSKYLYKPYREMGGDGTAEKLMEEVKKLPIKGDKE